MVYDLLGGEPLLHPHLIPLIRYMKTGRRHHNIVVLITNGFLLTPTKVAALNDAGLDMMQISVDSIVPTAASHKALKTVLPKLRMLAREARFSVKVQSVLTEQTCLQYQEFRHLLADQPFDFSIISTLACASIGSMLRKCSVGMIPDPGNVWGEVSSSMSMPQARCSSAVRIGNFTSHCLR
jgi:MoaA/NifB/PqqE/SkfB family radical SAM enzyme